jgi:hypothetical protein
MTQALYAHMNNKRKENERLINDSNKEINRSLQIT